MDPEFDYTAAMAQLEAIAQKVEDPKTPLGEVGAMVKRSKDLVSACRTYLRTLHDDIDRIDEEEHD